MYLKNGLIEFLKVKNVILLILGVTFTSISFSLMTQLVVGLHGDFLSIIRAGSLIAAFVFFVFGVSMIVYSRISRMMINEAVFFSGYFEGDLNGYVDFAELAEVTAETAVYAEFPRYQNRQLPLPGDHRALQQDRHMLLPQLRRLDGKARVF